MRSKKYKEERVEREIRLTWETVCDAITATMKVRLFQVEVCDYVVA